ncbi:helix-turn-helix domain-containing protein [Sphingomonas morindae]|uniref:DUF4019 domain-containing protein n=1 Tax=Sphingomonas morindae TaxID=1541170 RepID=A0ABY4X8H7_9SPHN|nr:DUF4019 domain-containing protein [Sphingomonas morindae]USI73188.1 DUF4019 domain-containing protein [Sphingomonas morindae]
MTTRATQGIEALTEREKQTLRLIARGHDAKSVARSLDLSVHTINERLREARRKLAVPSSREAARLLFAAEEPPPQNLGDSIIGEAPSPPNGAGHGPAERISHPRRIGSGGMAMALMLGLLALVALPQMETGTDKTMAAGAANAAVIATARHFLELGDQGDWTSSYRMTGRSFQTLNTVQSWTMVSQKVRTPLGAVRSRVLLGEQSLPAPPHGYEVVKFRTHFANRADAVETVTLEQNENGWTIQGVTIG